MKLFIPLLMAMMTITANAQNLEGMYFADQQFVDQANEYVKNIDIAEQTGMDLDLQVDCRMFFNGDNIDLIIGVKTEAQNVYVEGLITFMGKYLKEGDIVNCDFNKDNIAVSLQKLESDDPQIQHEIEENEDMIYNMVEGMMDEAVTPLKDKLFKVCEFCKSFEMKSVTDKSFTAVFKNDMEVNFIKP